MTAKFSGDAWLEEETARRYQEFTEKTSMYQELSRVMLNHAGLKPGMRVVDLGCGTGVTSQAILEALGTEGQVYAVDLSGPMLAVARKQLNSPQVSFIQADAGDFADLVETPVDRILCSSVFWQFRHKPQVLAQIRQVLAPDGLFVFNVPEPYFIFEDIPRSSKVGILFKQFAAERYGVGQQDLRTMEVFLHYHGFEIDRSEIITRVRSSQESYLFDQIPVATAWMDPPLDYDTRLKLLAEAYQLADPDQVTKHRWMYFVTRLRA
jgi:ubiquinone/menaquinone biosynthesis C-methylase UbiE